MVSKKGPHAGPQHFKKMFLYEWTYAVTQVVPRRVQADPVNFQDGPVIDPRRASMDPRRNQ